MAICAVQELLDEAGCFAAASHHEALKLSLLCRILQALDPMATCDVQSLLGDAVCFQTVADNKAIELQLLCNILDALGGGVGTNYVLLQDAPPAPAAPADPTEVWLINYRDGSNSQYWDPSDLTWH